MLRLHISDLHVLRVGERPAAVRDGGLRVVDAGRGVRCAGESPLPSVPSPNAHVIVVVAAIEVVAGVRLQHELHRFTRVTRADDTAVQSDDGPVYATYALLASGASASASRCHGRAVACIAVAVAGADR